MTFEDTATTIWRSLKKLGFSDKIGKGLFSPLIGFLAGREKMFLSPNENWGTKMRYLLRWYEPGSTKASKRFLKPGMNVLDIGADVGYYSRLFSELVGPKGRVWAFEPHPESFDLLKKNAALSRYQNITPIKKAVSDIMGESRLFVSKKPGKHSFHNVSPASSGNDLVVESTTVDNFLLENGNPQIDFIKIDIEGAEPKALDGMKNTVGRSRNLGVIMEFNARVFRLAGKTPPPLSDQLESMGFKVYAILASGRIKPVANFSQSLAKDDCLNIFCLKA